MSDLVLKVVIRAKIPGVNSRREHLQWMRENVGEPVEVIDDGNEDELWFTYEPEHRTEGTFPYYKECENRSGSPKKEGFGLELVLGKERYRG